MKIIEEEERLGWQRMKPRPELIRFLSAVRNSGIRTAIATRNSEESFGIFLEKAQLQAFSDDPIFLKPALFRDSLNGVNKPDAKARYSLLAFGSCLKYQYYSSLGGGACTFVVGHSPLTKGEHLVRRRLEGRHALRQKRGLQHLPHPDRLQQRYCA